MNSHTYIVKIYIFSQFLQLRKRKGQHIFWLPYPLSSCEQEVVPEADFVHRNHYKSSRVGKKGKTAD